eukprot:2451377-Rhodomonas_salina.2
MRCAKHVQCAKCSVQCCNVAVCTVHCAMPGADAGRGASDVMSRVAQADVGWSQEAWFDVTKENGTTPSAVSRVATLPASAMSGTDFIDVLLRFVQVRSCVDTTSRKATSRSASKSSKECKA